MTDPTKQLLSLAFVHTPMKEHFGDNPPARFHYLHRKFQDNHQYISLMFDYNGDTFDKNDPDLGKFLEAVVECYWGKKDTRLPKRLPKSREAELNGWKPVHCTIYRDFDSVVAAVSKEYQLSPEEKKKS